MGRTDHESAFKSLKRSFLSLNATLLPSSLEKKGRRLRALAYIVEGVLLNVAV